MPRPDRAAAELLAGPRGRRLCWSLLDPSDDPAWGRVWRAAGDGDLAGLSGELATCVARTDLASLAATAGEAALVEALEQPVDLAMYWQEPDPVDQALAAPAVRAALLPVAQAVLAAPAARWWPGPMATGRQQYVEWLDQHDFSPPWAGAAAALAAWRADTVAQEQSPGVPRDPAASVSGCWWSAPAHARLLSTTRSLPGLGAVRLALVEDGLGWHRARCWPVTVPPRARVYEVGGARDWADLVGRYPLDVSNSRRQDWWRVSGLAGRWLIPDFAAVAADYDAVHVSVLAYLATAGRPLPVAGAHTLLAGWDPDQAYWLTDVLAPAGDPVEWLLPASGSGNWAPAAAHAGGGD